MWCRLIDMRDDSSSLWFYWPMLGTGIGVAIPASCCLGAETGTDSTRIRLPRRAGRCGEAHGTRGAVANVFRSGPET